MSDGFYAQVAVLDDLRKVSEPTATQVSLLLEMLAEDKYRRYFFRDLANPAWLPALHDAGFFVNPPEPVETHDGYFQMPRWDADEYLIRIGHHHPELVVDTVTSICTENARVQENLLRAAVHLSPADAARIAPAAAAWLGGRFTGAVPERLAELMVYLTRGDQVHAALELLKALTEPTIDRPTGEEAEGIAGFLSPGARPRFDPHMLERIVETHLPEVAKVDPFGVLAILEEQLIRAITLEEEVNRWGAGADGSMIWRKAIEDHPQNSRLEGIKEVFVDAIRDILQSVGDQEEARAVVRRYLVSPYSIFRRLAIHTVRTHPGTHQDLLVSLFSDPGNLDATDIHHEFYMLMESAFDKAPRETQAWLLGWIVRGMPLERLEQNRQWYRERDAQAEADEELVHLWQQHWILRRLWALRNHDLPPEYRSRLDALVGELGEPDHPSLLSYTTSVSWTGSASPLDKTRMAQMSPDEVLAYLLVYEPTERDPTGPSLDGLMDVFREVVQEQAERYAAISPRFLEPGVKPAYALHLLRGLHEAWKTGVTFDWDAVLALCEGLLSRKDTSAREQSADSEEVLYRDCHAQVADFLRAALVREDLAIPALHLTKVRDILLRLLDHPEPTPQHERKWGGSNMDPATLSLNTGRGKAMHAIVAYAVYRARALQERGIEPGVKTALERRLDRKHELSTAVHSTFGQYLPQLHYLDAEWVLGRLPAIFPQSTDEEPYWQAAWNSYLAFNPVYTTIYEMLRNEYERAVRGMPLTSAGAVGFQRADHRLADHLMSAYWFQLEELDAEDSLLHIFFTNAPDEIRAHAIQFLGTWLRGAGALLKPEVWQRLRALWAVRVAAAEGYQDRSEFSKELSAFAGWLPSVHEPMDSLFELVRSIVPYVAAEVGVFGRQVADYLATQVKAYPREAALLFLELLRRETETVSWYRTDQETWTILDTAMRSGDAEAREHAEVAINLLGERGEYQYRDLLALAA